MRIEVTELWKLPTNRYGYFLRCGEFISFIYDNYELEEYRFMALKMNTRKLSDRIRECDWFPIVQTEMYDHVFFIDDTRALSDQYECFKYEMLKLMGNL